MNCLSEADFEKGHREMAIPILMRLPSEAKVEGPPYKQSAVVLTKTVELKPHHKLGWYVGEFMVQLLTDSPLITKISFSSISLEL